MSNETDDTEFNFEGARRGPVAPDAAHKTRITTNLDNDVLEALKARAKAESRPGHRIGYQTKLNQLLRQALGLDIEEDTRPGPEPGTRVIETKHGHPLVICGEDQLRWVIRDELDHAKGSKQEDDDEPKAAK
jgi:uncharacterized protein (DUF4415 family)